MTKPVVGFLLNRIRDLMIQTVKDNNYVFLGGVTDKATDGTRMAKCG